MTNNTTTRQARHRLKQALDECKELGLPPDEKREVVGLFAEGYEVAAMDPETALEYVAEIGYIADFVKGRTQDAKE